MTVDRMYSICSYIVAKNRQQGYLSPKDFNTCINNGQIEYLDYLLGEFEQYQYQRPVPKVQFGMNQQVRQSLTPLIGPFASLTVDGTGLSPYPSDFQQVDAMMTPGNKAIRYCQQHQKDAFINSRIDPVATNPIYLIQDDGFQYYPVNLGTALLSYVKTPPDIVWAYTPDGNGRPIYDPANSVDPVWYDLDCNQVIVRALKMVGVSLQAPMVSQYANEVEKVGQ
jgi:hypothetical protein